MIRITSTVPRTGPRSMYVTNCPLPGSDCFVFAISVHRLRSSLTHQCLFHVERYRSRITNAVDRHSLELTCQPVHATSLPTTPFRYVHLSAKDDFTRCGFRCSHL